ncbi:hypothetical protein SAMN02745163_03743 [Clostridium cavendishii DSM 21758]|uniref:Uncharacterized protein n=1 Tax=Clostridium cavendishii DSM 21758 TaxID=1121302 RepID=A0A1M6S3G2_9CLOT|nr:hypothetical protein [Clostridium cavendishii]SHK39283.1 hypothetical protein SAMN02745163_03743 [Clostridium cavendishii DSM 21758]
MKSEELHNLKVVGGKIKLDDFDLKGVTDYDLKCSALGTTELTLKIIVNSNVFVN